MVLVSICSRLVYRDTIDLCTLSLCTATLVESLISSRNDFAHSLAFYPKTIMSPANSSTSFWFAPPLPPPRPPPLPPRCLAVLCRRSREKCGYSISAASGMHTRFKTTAVGNRSVFSYALGFGWVGELSQEAALLARLRQDTLMSSPLYTQGTPGAGAGAMLPRNTEGDLSSWRRVLSCGLLFPASSISLDPHKASPLPPCCRPCACTLCLSHR